MFPAAAAKAGYLLYGNTTNNWSESLNNANMAARAKQLDMLAAMCVFIMGARKRFMANKVLVESDHGSDPAESSTKRRLEWLAKEHIVDNMPVQLVEGADAADAKYAVGSSEKTRVVTVKKTGNNKVKATCACAAASIVHKTNTCSHIESVVLRRPDRPAAYLDDCDTIGAQRAVHGVGSTNSDVCAP